MEDQILSKEAWPAQGIEHYSVIEDGAWGYLIFYKDKGFVFSSENKPSRDEILARWGGYLK